MARTRGKGRPSIRLHRTFGGERFSQAADRFTKADARIAANRMRREGWRIRIVRETAPEGRILYVIYRRRP